MILDPRLVVFLAPRRRAVLFALKGIIAMCLSLYLALFFQLERPYWALISAVFLQVRPETGLVIEKGLCQIGGTLVGGAMGLLILATLLPYPALALGALTLWIGLNAGFSAWMRQANFIYGFAMAGVTASLVVVLSIANPDQVSSAGIFQVAYARVSEIILGALCATLVSSMLWPVRVSQLLNRHARSALNQTLSYMELELDPAGTHSLRHGQADTLLQGVFALNDDSSAVLYEGSYGPGLARAATLICHKTLSLVARIRVFGRLMRNHGDLLTPALETLVTDLRSTVRFMRQVDNGADALARAHQFRRQLKQQQQAQRDDAPALQRRLYQVAMNLAGDLIVALEAHHALKHSEKVQLRPPSLKAYRDLPIALAVGLRSALVFLLAALLWVSTASSMAIMLMIMPVIFTILFARLPAPDKVLRRAAFSSIIAAPVALFFTLPLLAQSSGDFLLLAMAVGAPLFLGLIAISDPQTLPFGLGFCTPFVLLVQPGDTPNFATAQVASNGLAVTTGIILAYLMFRLITPPRGGGLRQRLLRQTTDDLVRLNDPGFTHNEEWFNARMADRLRWLTVCDHALPEQQRYFTDLGLTGLNLGQVSFWVQSRLSPYQNARLAGAAGHWQRALARAYEQAARGHEDGEFRQASQALLNALAHSGEHNPRRLAQMRGAMERMALTFSRVAERFADSSIPSQEGKKAL